MTSKITGGPTDLLFEATVLSKYKVAYYRCRETGFIQTEEPYWLNEAYASAITKLDIGLVQRNLKLSDQFGKLIALNFNKDAQFLDFAGGYGLFTRMMRDKGFQFYHTDMYCQNLFAEFFDANRFEPGRKYELVTAMEVFEHMNDPLKEISELFGKSDTVLFTTELVPQNYNNTKDWWYFTFETGQHIALYTEKALQHIAGKFNCNFYSNGQSVHLFTKRTFAQNPFKALRDPFLTRKLKKWIFKTEEKKYHYPESLLEKDWKMIKDLLSK